MLKALGVGAVGLSTPVDAKTTDSSVPYKSLRGQITDPLSTTQIQSARQKFTKKALDKAEPSEYALLNADHGFESRRIIGYNIIGSPTNGIKEQYITQEAGMGEMAVSTSTVSPIEDRLHKKADELLEKAISEQTSATRSTIEASTSEYDIAWNEWLPLGSTDYYGEYLPKSENWGESKPGRVEIVSDIRRSPDSSRAGARTHVRMEPGRQICNSRAADREDYCIPLSDWDGWRNRDATVYHDWDTSGNNTPTSDLIEDYDPYNKIGGLQRLEPPL